MKRVHNWFLVFVVVCFVVSAGLSQSLPALNELLIRNEEDPAQWFEGKNLTKSLGLPLRITTSTGELIEVLGIAEGRPLYGVFTNTAHPLEGGYTLCFEEISKQFDLADAKILYGSLRNGEKNYSAKLKTGGKLLLIPDWTADKVMAFDPVTGNLVDTAFIHSNPTALASPKDALMSPWGFITVSDQIKDLVQAFDTAGAYIAHFAPAGGVNNAILDNLRGHGYRPGNKNLVVTVASGTNTNSIAEFDSAGNYVGNFVANGAGGLNSPFSILFRSDDVLITTSSGTQGIYRYNLDGTFNSIFATLSTGFLQQIIELEDRRIAVANFSGTGIQGIRLYTATGTFLQTLAGVTGNRGVYQLPSGNFLTTNGTGLHELDGTTGTLVRTIYAASSLQYITLVEFPGPVTSVRTIENSVPEQFVLFQNYPNPFNPSTNIQFQVPNAGHVTLRIYDVLGREVALPVDQVMNRGSYETTFDATSLAGGVYLYTLVSGDQRVSKKMLLLK